MKWVLLLALVGLVSLAESRSINYEYEDKQGLDSEQKGYAGDVTGKYETMDHNGNVVEVKYIADHMGFRLMGELEVTDKNINSPNAELEMEPTEHKTQIEEQKTNEPIDSSVKLAKQKMETTTQTILEGVNNEGEEPAQKNTEIELLPEGEGNEIEGEKAGEEAEAGEAEAGEAEGDEAIAGEAEGEETEGEGAEAEAGEAEGEEAEGEEAEGEETEGDEAEGEEAESEEAESEEAEGEEAEGEEAEGEEEGEGAEGEEAEAEDAEVEEAEAEEEGEGAEGVEAEAEEAGGEEAGVEEAEAEETEETPTVEQEDELPIDGESKNLEEELENNDSVISKRKGEDLENNEHYQLTEILQVPTAKFETISILAQNRIGFEQDTVGRSSKAKSLLSVQNIGNAPITDGRYKHLTKILQVPTSDFIKMPQPLQVIDVNNRKSDEQEIVYYDNQSSDVSNIRISEVKQELNVLPKRMVSITSKQLNNINPGTVMIEKISISDSQSNPETVLVHMNEQGRLTIEAHPVKKELTVDPFRRRSSMIIESEKIDEKVFNVSEEPKIVVREIFTSEGSVPSQLLDSQPKIKNIDAEPLVTITSKQLNNVNPGTVMIERTSISESQSSPEVVLVRMEYPGKLTIEAQPVKKEIAFEPLSKRTSMEIEPFRQLLEAQSRIETKEAESLVILPIYPKPSKVNLRLLPITIEKSLADNMPKFTNDQEMVIETDVIDDIPVPMALIQPAVSKTHILKKISDRNVPKQFLRFAPKPTPVLLRHTPSIQLFEEALTTIEMISQQPTPKEVRIIEVRSAPKPMTILQVNPIGQLQISDNEQVIFDNKNTKITRELITEDVTSHERQSFKVRDFVRF